MPRTQAGATAVSSSLDPCSHPPMDPLAPRPKSLLGSLLEFHDPRWRPAVDVYRARGTWLCKFDLAGVAAADVEVTTRGHSLVVAGLRRDRTVREGLQAWSLEISYPRFERSLELPCRLEDAGIACTFQDGMLLVTITECEADGGDEGR